MILKIDHSRTGIDCPQIPDTKFYVRGKNWQQALNLALGGRPGGAVVKFAHSASVAGCSLVQILGTDLCILIKPCCGRCPTYKTYRKMSTDVSSGLIFLSKNGGFAVDVGSGLTFLKKIK